MRAKDSGGIDWVYVCMMTALVSFVVVGMLKCSSMLNDSDEQELKKQRSLAVDWTKWSNEHCDTAMHLYGGESHIGKYTYVFSGQMLSCDNRQTYVVSRRVNECLERLGACRGIEEYVPSVPQSVNKD